MSNKELKLKGRVQNKHKTEAEWYLDVYKAADSTELRDDPFIPLNGELIIYDPEPDSGHPERRLKIGDGVTNVVALSFYEEELATVDKVEYIDEWYGDMSINECSGEGIVWTEQFALLDDSNNELKVGEMYQRIPIIAGNNVEFEVDEEHQVVKINATGGGSTDTIVGTWTFINDPEILPVANISLSFISNGKKYISFKYGYIGPSQWNIWSLYYCVDGNDELNDPVYYYNPSGENGITHGWANEAYRTIDIIDGNTGGHPLTDDFITWLKANATKNSSTFPSYDASNEGAFLRIVGGVPTWATISNAEDNAF